MSVFDQIQIHNVTDPIAPDQASGGWIIPSLVLSTVLLAIACVLFFKRWLQRRGSPGEKIGSRDSTLQLRILQRRLSGNPDLVDPDQAWETLVHHLSYKGVFPDGPLTLEEARLCFEKSQNVPESLRTTGVSLTVALEDYRYAKTDKSLLKGSVRAAFAPVLKVLLAR